jgi:hypothetical protein
VFSLGLSLYSIDLFGATSGFCLASFEAAVVDRSKAQSLLNVVASEVSFEKADLDDLRFNSRHLSRLPVDIDVGKEVLGEAFLAHLGAFSEVDLFSESKVEVLCFVMDEATELIVAVFVRDEHWKLVEDIILGLLNRGQPTEAASFD